MSKFKHLPGCAHAQNIAKPRSLQLIGPKCDCHERRKCMDDFKEQVESGEFDEVLNQVSEKVQNA